MSGPHPSHVTRMSDASTFDEICVNCGATDQVPGGWGQLALPCPHTKLRGIEMPTPGPWEYDGGTRVCIPHRDGLACFRVPRGDARAIALVPDLLMLLRRYVTQHCVLSDQDGLGTLCECTICQDTRATLARAEGR